MDVDLARYVAYRTTVRRFLLFGGIWPNLDNLCKGYRLVAIIWSICFAVVGGKIFSFCFSNFTNISLFVQGMSNAFSLYTSLFKIICCLLYRSDFVMLNESLDRHFDEHLRRLENRPFLLKQIHLFTRFMYVISGFTATVLLLHIAVTFSIIFKYHKYLLIYQGDYPFPMEPGGPIYWTIYSIECLVAVCLWSVLGGVDNSFGINIFRMCGLLRLLSDRFCRLSPNNPNYIAELRDCMRTQELLLRSRIAIQNVFGPIVIWTYLSSALIMCSLLYQIDQTKKQLTLAKLIFFAFFVILKLVQSFVYAYYGSIVAQESEKCQNAVYISDWTGSGNLRLMKDILLIQMQRPIVLKACGFFIVSMQLFEKIINTTISYFFLLKTLGEE